MFPPQVLPDHQVPKVTRETKELHQSVIMHVVENNIYLNETATTLLK